MISRNLTGTGLSGLAAQAIAGIVNEGLTATGTNQATALLISADLNVFGTVSSGSGCILPIGGENDQYSIVNDGANALLIYPPVGGTINGGAVNAAISLAAGSAIQINFQTSLAARILSNVISLASSAGASLIGFIQSGAGAIARTVQSKERDIISTADFDSVASANAIAGTKIVPNGTVSTSLASTGLDGPYVGPGQIIDSASRKRGKYFAAVKAAPSSLGNESGGIETAFTGDMSLCQFSVEHRITGAATAGQPTSGYSYRPEITPHYTFLYNESGWNNSTSTNGGRTGICANRINIYHAGQGDAVAYNATAFCNSTKPGSTSFLANPAVVLFNGDVSSGADGVYLNPIEIGYSDNGFDAAALGPVIKMTRTNATGAKNAWWCGKRIQSLGSVPIDVGYSAYGPMNIGLDFSFATLPAAGSYQAAAIVMKADQRFYGNSNATDASGIGRFPSVLNNDYFTYSSSLVAWNFVVGNASALQIYSTKVGANRPLSVLRAGDGLQVKEGSNAKQGVSVAMVAGSVTVSNTSVTANSRIFISRSTSGGTLGHISYTKSAGVGFTIVSSSALETSSFDYQIFEPA